MCLAVVSLVEEVDILRICIPVPGTGIVPVREAVLSLVEEVDILGTGIVPVTEAVLSFAKKLWPAQLIPSSFGFEVLVAT
jgi:hypothetical protein